MLLQFSVNNYRSIKDTAVFSMQTASQDEGNCFQVRDYQLLNSAVIYGANASGKSNLLKAMAAMRSLVLNNYKISQSTDKLPHDPFKLSNETEEASTTFEIVFFVQNVKYRYGFEYDNVKIYAEWLFSDEKGKESKLFYRDIEDEFYVNPTRFKEGKGLEQKTLHNHLFLWKCDSENGEISKLVLKWFNNFNMVDGLENRAYIEYTRRQLDRISFKNDIIKLVRVADLGIDDVATHEEEVPSELLGNMPLPDDIKEKILNNGSLMRVETTTSHKKFDKNGREVGYVQFELDADESEGTKKFFAMSAPILDTLKNGKILIIDELDASLHPILTMHLIGMFHDPDMNKKNAQLIFATHDTNLLQNDLLRRDQVWFAEKNKFGATEIYSLVEYKQSPTRKTTNKENSYLKGRYGGIPYIEQFELEVQET